PGLWSQCALKEVSKLSTNRLACCQLADGASPPELFNLNRGRKNDRGLPHAKTLSRGRVVGMVYSGFVILSSFDIRLSTFACRPGDGLHDGRQINLIAREFAHFFSVAQH